MSLKNNKNDDLYKPKFDLEEQEIHEVNLKDKSLQEAIHKAVLKREEELKKNFNENIKPKHLIERIFVSDDDKTKKETSFELDLDDDCHGYTKIFKKLLVYENKPAPKDLFVVKKEKNKGFVRNFVDFWKNFYKKTISFGRKILELLHIVSKKEDEFNFSEYMEKAETEIIFNKPTKVVAEINDVYLTFKNPADPKEKNLVLRGPTLRIYEGKIHAIIGESGSGKSVITSLLYGLTGTNAIIEEGSVKLYGLEVQNYSLYNWEKSKLRGRVVSAVFQNPMSILDPTMKVGKQIIEGMLVNKIVKTKKEAYTEAIKYLEMTKINNPKKVMNLYPHELSGGMIQRIAIAAIVSLKPKILVMDEPTTALDPTVQALVLDIVRELQEKFKISIVFITHDLGVVASIADFINIMYAGQIIESGTKEEILMHPQHPYTWGLIISMPDFNNNEKLHVIRGAVPSNLNNIQGDAFAVRNDYALTIDFSEEPPFYQISPTHYVKSSLLNSNAPGYIPPKIIKNLWNKYELTLKTIYKKSIFVDNKTFSHYKEKSKKHNLEVQQLILKRQNEETKTNIGESK